MQRAEKKLQLSHNVVGDDVTEQKGKETGAVETSDLRSIIFGLHTFDPSVINSENSDELNFAELNDMTQRVISMRGDPRLGKDDKRFEPNLIDQKNVLDVVTGGNSALASYDPGLDEASYLSWVEKFKEASQSSGNQVLDLGNRRNLPEDRHLKLESARKKAEERKLSKWEALGYHSLSVKDPIYPLNVDALSDSGSVHFVVGDCTFPAKVCPSEPAVIFR